MPVTPTIRAFRAMSAPRSAFARRAARHPGQDQRDQDDQPVGGIDPERGDLREGQHVLQDALMLDANAEVGKSDFGDSA